MRGEEKTVFELLKEGLESTLERVKTSKPLRVTQLEIPDPPPVYSPQDVMRLRARLNLSQSEGSKRSMKRVADGAKR